MIDPERYATPLAIAGSVAVVVAIASASWVGFPLAGVGLALLAAACVSRRDGFLLTGPYLHHDLTRTTRRFRIHLWRALALCVLVIPMLALALFAFGPVDPAHRVPPQYISTVAEGGFFFVAWHLFLILSATTANFLAASVSEDREAKRLDFTLATDLRSREIVIGKAIARSIGAFGYILAAVPLVLVLPALFGVDPFIILVCIGFAIPSILSVGGLAVYGSVVSKTKKMSGMMPGRVLGLYAILGIILTQFNTYAIWFWPGTNLASASFSVGDAVDLFNCGNPFALGRKIAFNWGGGINLVPVLDALPFYAAFHVGIGLLYLLLAVRRLRPVSAALAGEPPPPEVVRAAAKRPAVFDRPVLWKDMYCVPAQARTRQAKITGIIVIVLFAVLPAAVFLYAAVVQKFFGATFAGNGIVEVSRWVPAVIVVIVVIAAMNLAGGTVAQERERDTLPSLLTTPLTAREILWQKFLGIHGQCRIFVYWQLIVGVPAVLCGGVEWWAFLVLLVGQVLFTALAVCIGLAASARAATVAKASQAVAIWFAAWFFGTSILTAFAAAAWKGASGSQDTILATLVGFFPPAGLLLLGQTHHMEPGTLPFWVLGYALGWTVYALAAWQIWRLAVRRFEAATGETGEAIVSPLASQPVHESLGVAVPVPAADHIDGQSQHPG